ncbi:hypothetical protein GCM10019016_021660 [Streptomyces prasinosporus]|uniref:Uncharacterized protein n=1 Tax=Streptomyces prasinosporus TaxID=68256 RepID=A0ABP6TIL5_9ACTN
MTAANATREIGPYGASADGSAKTPVPMMLPITRAVAAGKPSEDAALGRRSVPAPPGDSDFLEVEGMAALLVSAVLSRRFDP